MLNPSQFPIHGCLELLFYLRLAEKTCLAKFNSEFQESLKTVPASCGAHERKETREETPFFFRRLEKFVPSLLRLSLATQDTCYLVFCQSILIEKRY